MKSKLAVYLRVSTDEQKADSQKRDITRWLKGHGHDPKKVQWFVDQQSGATP